MRLVLVLVAACGAPAARPLPGHEMSSVEVLERDRTGPCGMLDAIYATSDPYYRKYFIHADLHLPLTFQIVAPPSVFPASTLCLGRPFRIFHGERDLLGAVVVLGIRDVGGVLRVSASLDQPNLTPKPGGGFDGTNYYTSVDGLIVERFGDHWRTISPER